MEDWTIVVIVFMWVVTALVSLGVTGFIIWVIWKVVEKFVLN